ncbi:RNA 2',3'-cyclic phosphodiesterase [Alkalibacillus haloalkaliphilus]|uniref:RNA 2',3'-cyclic phosphodiesterase n=1 Tax=Alkalibacillus haloalkaliphilus TaxID=94136 RepID=A0A511W4C3_9BACI|nr:RNA 2',3'-cyclic phosphodiesterase [Alkalibacillus haloalkaliphilus]GEN45954.1 RNA 2',3'-cyclic phosphodiesterase [Alkalibacillus haloalkaliphilus]
MNHYFIGIKVPNRVALTLSQWQQHIKPYVSYRGWVHELDFHLTLKFLGPVSEQSVAQLEEYLQDITVPQFDISINGLSYFGKKEQPRVLFAKVQLVEPLSDLKEKVEKAAAALNFDQDKRSYKPHITLAKKWKDKTVLSTSLNNKINDPINHFRVEEFQLFKIHPQNEPKYEIVKTFTLKETGE